MNPITDLRTRRPFSAALPTRFDVHVAPLLTEALDRARHAHIEIDGNAVTFIDAAGLAALVLAAEVAASNGGSFMINNPSPALQITLELTNTDLMSPGAAAANALVAA